MQSSTLAFVGLMKDSITLVILTISSFLSGPNTCNFCFCFFSSSLYSKSEQIVQKALNNVMKGRTNFVIAHRLSTI